jgi:hypothetical protein
MEETEEGVLEDPLLLAGMNIVVLEARWLRV